MTMYSKKGVWNGGSSVLLSGRMLPSSPATKFSSFVDDVYVFAIHASLDKPKVIDESNNDSKKD